MWIQYKLSQKVSIGTVRRLNYRARFCQANHHLCHISYQVTQSTTHQ